MKILSETSEVCAHKSVLIDEVIEHLDIKPGGVYIDVTFGAGGHSRAILQKEPNCRLIAFDWDFKSIEQYAKPLEDEFPGRFKVIWGNFAHLYLLLKKEKITRVDGILADFGTSQMQIKSGAGFSLYVDSPLDMRMSPGHQKITAEIVLRESTEKKLETIFKEYGQEKYARKIAKAIVERRVKKRFQKTKDLTLCIEEAVGKKVFGKIHPATKVFQALRIYVNRELENIHSFLCATKKILAHNGTLVCISFHSLEDTIVKQFLQQEEREGGFIISTKRVVTPADAEIELNAASRSSKLRAARRVIDKNI